MKIPGLIGSFLATATLAVTVAWAAQAGDIIINTRTTSGQEKKNYIDPTPNMLLGVAPDGTTPAGISAGPGITIAGNQISSSGGGGGGAGTNLTQSTTSTTVTVISDTGADAILPAATTSSAGVMSAADKTALGSLISGGGSSTPVNLAGGTAMTVGVVYYDTFAAARALSFVGTETPGSFVELNAVFTAAAILTFPSSKVVPGNNVATTTLPVNAGKHYFRWDFVNGERLLTHTALPATTGQIFVGDSVTGTMKIVTMGGDATIDATGAVTVTGGGGGGGTVTPINLAGGTALAVGSVYYDTFAANRTLSITGTETPGSFIELNAVFTVAATLTFPLSKTVPGDNVATTTLAVNAGKHYFRWDFVNGERLLTHTALPATTGQIFVGDSTTGTMKVVTMSGDATINAAGVVTVTGGGGGGGTGVPLNSLILYPTALVGSLPSGFLVADGTNGTLTMSAIGAGTWIQRLDAPGPTLTSATINGAALTLNWSAPVSNGASFNTALFSLDAVTTGYIPLAYASGSGTATHNYTAVTPVITGEVVTFDFAGGANVIEATTGGADVALINNAPVTNTTSGGGTPFVLTQPGAATNAPATNFQVGYVFTTTTAITITELGWRRVSDNNPTMIGWPYLTVKLFDNTGLVELASVAVDLSTVAVDEYAYASITPVSVASSASRHIRGVHNIYVGFSHMGVITNPTHTAVADITSFSEFDGTTLTTAGSYGALCNFKYTSP